MQNLHDDNHLDDLSRQAADTFEPDHEVHSWEKLRPQLDAALPQKEERKRRFLFFFLLFLLIGGGAIFSALWSGRHKEGIAQKKAIEQIKQTEQTTGASKNDNTATVDNTSDKSSDKSLNKPTQAGNNTPVTTTQKTDNTSTTPTNNNNTAPSYSSAIKNSKNDVTNQSRRNTTPSSNNRKKNNNKASVAVINNNEPQVTKRSNSSATPDKKPSDTEPNDTKLTDENKSADQPKSDQPKAEEQKADQQKTEQPKTEQATTNTASSNKTKKNTPVKSRWEFGLTFAPDISTVKFTHTQPPGTNFGITIGYNFSKRFAVQTGFLYTSKNYKSYGKDYHPPKGYWTDYVKLETVTAECDMYDIPLNLRYNLAPRKNSNIFASAGLSSYLMKKENYNFFYYYNGNPVSRFRSMYTDNQHWFSVLNLSFAYEKQVGRNISLQAEPFFKQPLKGLGFGDVKLNSTGIYFSVKYKPLAGKQTTQR